MLSSRRKIWDDIFEKLAKVDEENRKNNTPTMHAEDAKPFSLTILEDGPLTNTEGENDITVFPPSYQRVQWTDGQQLSATRPSPSRRDDRVVWSADIPVHDPYKLGDRQL
ncbi:hypothetical protein E1B28_005507 [Marasmius oreades]|uniref:Uncharacterized protein n=1 Tax=Marasmius oreades TaxID=181124 RepID=A0A9P7S3U4_9AGAR|nr:uncharacterized protein E1B28_005507 [Marasmius oreades]KAG7094688.1 hypothetical protein E1B28_005507 [Marasmius oreades]